MKKIISIFLALLILTSNFNLTLAMHYCGGEVSEYAIQVGEVDLSCGMEKQKECTSPFAEMLSKTNHCCDNSSFTVDIDDYFSPYVAEFDFNSSNSQAQTNFFVAFTATFVAPHLNIFSLGANPKIDFKYYFPPLLDQDFLVLNQTFLI